MLLPREKRILEILYAKKQGYTSSELAAALHISLRTVKTDIKRIREELEKTGCEILTKAGKGIWLSYDSQGKKYLDSLLLGGECASSMDPKTRKYYIALQLLDSDTYISTESISNSMYISKGTATNDINELIPFFEKQGLTLEKRVKYGIRLLGKESQLRIAKASVIRKIVVYQGSQVSRKLQPFFEDLNIEHINAILQEAEEHFGFILSDASYSELLIHCSIIVRRIRKGKVCAIDETELRAYSEMKEWGICRFIADALEKSFSVHMTEGDRSYLMMNLLGTRMQEHIPAETYSWGDDGADSGQILEQWEDILRHAGDMFHENLIGDETLKIAMFLHLKAMFNRLQHQIHLENPMKRMVREELVYEFEVATYVARLIKEEFHADLGEDEICDIALYLGASLERERAMRNRQSPVVTIVCGSGIGTSQFFEAKLGRIFPEIQVRKIVPISRARYEIGKDTQDFVLATVPLELEGIEVLNVSPMLGERDALLIEERIHPERRQLLISGKEKYPALFALMSERISIFKCDCRSLEEVISLMGRRLIHEKYVKEGFIESVLKREELAPTSIGDKFAVPHAFEGYVLKTGVGLMTLKKPIVWGNEKVQIIMMLSIDIREQEQFREIFSELAAITKNKWAIEQILNAERISDIKIRN